MEKTWNKITLQWDPPIMANEIRQYRVSIIYKCTCIYKFTVVIRKVNEKSFT